MSLVNDPIGESGLRFFGKISASISHEIKNAIAVMNENAGLIKDLMMMAERGRSVDLGRIQTLAGKISEQIRRTDGILTNMNRFAHSVDHSISSVDVSETLKLTVDLSTRFADMLGIQLNLEQPMKSVKITTSPFLLENMVYLCLDHAMGTVSEEKKLFIKLDEDGRSVNIRFTGIQSSVNSQASLFPSETETALLKALGAEITLDPEKGWMTLSLLTDRES
jgi:C4-dicarboxylate-specific signal transduction histidine kinase